MRIPLCTQEKKPFWVTVQDGEKKVSITVHADMKAKEALVRALAKLGARWLPERAESLLFRAKKLDASLTLGEQGVGPRSWLRVVRPALPEVRPSRVGVVVGVEVILGKVSEVLWGAWSGIEKGRQRSDGGDGGGGGDSGESV